MAVRVIAEDAQYPLEMNAAGTKLVVVDFTASWYNTIPWLSNDNLQYLQTLFQTGVGHAKE